MENTTDYSTCMNLANAILGNTTFLNDPYVTYSVPVDVTNISNITVSNNSLVINTQ